MPADPRLLRLLGGTALVAVRQRLRTHFERGGEVDATMHFEGLQPVEREALALMIGRPPRAARSIRVDLADLQTALQAAGIAGSLVDALEQLDGPLRNLVAETAAARAAWASAWSTPGRDPRLAVWLTSAYAAGLVKRLSRQDVDAAVRLLDMAGSILSRLPGGGIPHAQLAAEMLGDAHALDAGRPVATVVLAVWRHVDPVQASMPGDVDAGEDASDDPANSSSKAVREERARDVWARAGVLVNELARPALALNLPALPEGTESPWIAGEPAFLSLRWLLRTDPKWDVGDRPVFVCENPNLLAIAADRLGSRAFPLVCTDGMPGAAQRTLLEQLVRHGAQLRCHGDFDAGGVRIVNNLLRHAGAAAWRMAVTDYEDAVQRAGAERHPLKGAVAEAHWDANLAASMRRHRVAIAEEAIGDVLLDDLSL